MARKAKEKTKAELGEMRMTHGKYAGVKLCNIDREYLELCAASETNDYGDLRLVQDYLKAK